MEYVFYWSFFSLVVAVIGATRKVGGFAAFLISILLSPLVGLIAVLTSKYRTPNPFENQSLSSQRKALAQLSKPEVSVPDELERMRLLVDQEVLTQEDFDIQMKWLLFKHSPN